MNKVRDLFDPSRPIDRPITSVINYAGDDDPQLEREIREYEVTDKLARHYERFMANLNSGFQSGGGHEIGVWVSGFYGSGKSSFTKYLGFALDPARKLAGEPFLKALQHQFPSAALRQQLGSLAARFPSTVIMLDLAAVASVDSASKGVSRLLYWKVMEWAGYSKDEKLALLELLLEKDGKLEAFKQRFRQIAKGREWEQLKNDLLLGVSLAAKIASEFYPEVWSDAKAFNDTRIDARYGEDERVKQMLDVVERRTKSRRVIFLVDEVGGFIEGNPHLILNVQGLAENLKNVGKGQAWLVATAQQTLPMTGPLFKLKDRFPDPLRVDLESSDIREITHRRLLRKSAAGEAELFKAFSPQEGALNHATQLKNTKFIDGSLTREVFANLYPFLPQHFTILMELLRSLARSTGGIGLRSAIKVIQDVLVDVSGHRPGAQLLADGPVGALATADVFFDTLRRDIERANRELVETVDRVGTAFGHTSLHYRVAKGIAVLQLIDGFPVSRENVSAMLHTSVTAAPLKTEVENAVKDLLAEKSLPISDPDGSLRFMSQAVSAILTEKAGLQPSSTDVYRILGDRLKEMLSPEPSALVEGTLKVKTQLKLVQGSMPLLLTHTKEEIETHLELVPANELSHTVATRVADAMQPSNQNLIYAVGEDSTSIRDLTREIFQCEEIFLRHRAEAADKEVAEFVRSQSQRAETLKRDLETALQNGFLKGSFVFRGRPHAVATRGTELLAACKAQLASVASDVFNRYREAPIPGETALAERLLQTKDLASVPSATDPLGLVQKKGQATAINVQHAALVSILDYLRKHGEVDGKKLLDDFDRAPFGWSKDTTRYLVSALLIAGRIRLRIGAEWIKVPGQAAVEGLKSNVAFGKVDIATNEETIPQDALLRASQRLLSATGQTILPMPQNISRAVRDHFPAFQREHAGLAAELTRCGLPGAERAGRLQKQLAQILQGDASEAPAVLGAEESELVGNLVWARETRKALANGLEGDAMAAGELLREVPQLPKVGAADALVRETEAARSELTSFLAREDCFKFTSDIRSRVSGLQALVKAAAAKLHAEFTTHLDGQAEAIRSSASWALLPESDRSELSKDLEALAYSEPADLAGIRRLLNSRIEIDSDLERIRKAVEARAQEALRPPPLVQPPVDAPGEEATPPSMTPTVLRLRRSYSSVAEVQALITTLQQALASGRPIQFEIE